MVGVVVPFLEPFYGRLSPKGAKNLKFRRLIEVRRALCSECSIRFEQVVSVVDKGSNTQYSTRFFGQLPLVDGGALLHCEPMHAEALLSEVHPRKIAGLTATREG